MRAKDILEICEELEDLAAVGKALTNGTVPDGEVAVTEDNRRLLAFFRLIWSIRP
jgi:archaeosine-15-forming tRNA-guanine transglycosylase